MSITLYGKATCAPCKTLRYFLDKKNLVYKYIEGDTSVRIYPTLDIDGRRLECPSFALLNSLLAL